MSSVKVKLMILACLTEKAYIYVSTIVLFVLVRGCNALQCIPMYLDSNRLVDSCQLS